MRPGSKKGDGFSCEILAVDFSATFDGQTLSKEYIAKFAPGQARAEMLTVVGEFRTPFLGHGPIVAMGDRGVCLPIYIFYMPEGSFLMKG
jgi:hypothetical protein